jgi:23S rRNA (adenine2503-C2)-methyltransferase
MTIEKFPLLDLSLDQLEEYLDKQGWAASHADRILRWVYHKLVTSFEEMSELPSALKQQLAESASLVTMKPLDEKISTYDQTHKVLFELDDGKTIESTLMIYRKPGLSRVRRTVCVSSQVGCPIGCSFCATGQQGFERNLRPGEILEQILFFWRLIRSGSGESVPGSPLPRITNIVFMGMGEPLANYDNVRQAIHILNSSEGFGLGLRQITLSTSGLVPQIKQLEADSLQAELAVSLHAATDAVRNQLVPVNARYPLSQLIPACKEYSARKKCRIFYEYALFDGINDSETEARNLVCLLVGQDCSVNLILPNPISTMAFQPSSMEQALVFQKIIIAGGIRCMIRLSKGVDVDGGCGQLKSRNLNNAKQI